MTFFIKFKDFCYYNRKIIGVFIFFIFVFFFFTLEFYIKKEKNNEVIINNDIEDDVFDNVEVKEVFFIVDIKGAIKNPGTYEVSSEKRIIDVINMAGGTLENSDTTNVNLSKKVFDEMVIYIPFINTDSNNSISNNGYNDDNLYEEIVSDGKVSINNASLSELMKIKGIGEVKAKAIIEYRTSNGFFSNIEDIKNVTGIGNSTFEKIKDYIKL